MQLTDGNTHPDPWHVLPKGRCDAVCVPIPVDNVFTATTNKGTEAIDPDDFFYCDDKSVDPLVSVGAAQSDSSPC